MPDKPTDKKQPEEVPAPERRSGVQIREDLPEGEFGEPHQMMPGSKKGKGAEPDEVRSSDGK